MAIGIGLFVTKLGVRDSVKFHWYVVINVPLVYYGRELAQLVEALRCKQEGRGFDSRWGHWDFSLNKSFRSTQPLTELSTRDVSWGKGGRCIQLMTFPPSCAYSLEIQGASGPWSINGLSRPVKGQLYF
jgi:hypothetical protein